MNGTMKTARVLCAGIGLLTVTAAQAQELRYTTTVAGGITAAGNTLGLSNAPSSNGPGLNGSIGTFIAADSSSVDTTPQALGTPWGAGTTNDWTENESSAFLYLPDGAQVQYAELVWSGSYQYGGGGGSTCREHDHGGCACFNANERGSACND